MLLPLLLGVCLVRGGDTVTFDARVSSQLATTVRSGLFLATVRIDGQAFGPFLIDTGAEDVVFDIDLASKVSLSRLPYYSKGAKTVRELEVGPITLNNSRVLPWDLSRVTQGLRGAPSRSTRLFVLCQCSGGD
jgi:hypothetical protein